MKVRQFLQNYLEDPGTGLLLDALKKSSAKDVALSGVSGSLDAVLAAALQLASPEASLFILNDKEEAAYFFDDLRKLLERQEGIYLFPASCKKPYQYEETDNANVLQRAEVLSALLESEKTGNKILLVSYPEALAEQVLNRQSLISESFHLKKGELINFDAFHERMHQLGYEKTDFVVEPGQFAMRGFIVDVFSYSSEHPFRMELLDDEIESIRQFHPETQLSIRKLEKAVILPNVQTRLLLEKREGLPAFLPPNSRIWIKNQELCLGNIARGLEKITAQWEMLSGLKGSGNLVSRPEELFCTADSFAEQISRFPLIYFGSKAPAGTFVIDFQSRPQPSFNKDFKLLGSTLQEWKSKGWRILICAGSPGQLERLQTIFDETNPGLHFESLFLDLRAGFEDSSRQLVCYTDHEIFQRFHKATGRERFSKSKALTLRELKTLKPGDFVTHIDYGIGRFAGLEKIQVGGREQEAVRLVYRDNDYLFVSIHSLHKISRYSGKEGEPPAISKLGSEEWDNKKKKVKKRVKDIAKDLIKLYARRRESRGFAFSPDSYLQVELESSFLYEDTPDQAKASQDVKNDMEKACPMDRLVCGDVGFGKTEVAIRAAFKAVNDSKQVAVLVPTTILAMQHYKTFRQRLEGLPCNVEYISRFKSQAEISKILEKVKKGETDILIGTHMLLGKKIEFKDLGLMVVDEEQKFGVKAKEKLKELKVDVDNLTLTATPIPRTLQHSLMGSRDLSIIATPPPNRQPVSTEVHTFSETILRDAVRHELSRGGQVFFIHNRIGDLDALGNLVLKLVPDARVAVAHGQMEGSRLEDVMLRFMEGETDVLVSTNIVESGLDIPNANTIIINQAQMFGLSDVHQMRGRVGRSNRKAYCYLFTPPQNLISADARKRLTTLEEFSELGDGFKVAMRDLDIRGAGDLLGAEQSGFITDLGFEAYHKILDEAIQELKETEFRSLFESELAAAPLVKDCVLETDLELLIPDSYIQSVTERLALYTQLDDIKSDEELKAFRTNLQDRFGPVPEKTLQLINSVRLRWLAEKLGFEKLVLKNGLLRGTFVSNQESPFFQSEVFGNIISFVSANPAECQLKEKGNKLSLSFSEVRDVESALNKLGALEPVEKIA
jgi:transcription-repair coupling factor (superfamily II helicase)